MATNVGDLYLNLKLDVKNLQDGVNKSQKELKKVGKNTRQTAKEFQFLNNNMIRTMRRMQTVAVAAVAVYRAFDNIILAGVKLNQQYEDQALGIAALTAAKTKLVTATGEELGSYEKFLATQNMTKDVMDDIKKAALETPASFQQMVGFYQQTIGHAISSTNSFGESMADVNKNVITFTQRMSTMGSAAGMEMTKVNEEIRSIMSGNASTDSLLALMLFGSPTEANKAVKDAKTRVNGLSDLLLEATAEFKNLEAVRTYTKAMAQMGAAMDDTRRESMKPFFEDLKDLADMIKMYFTDNNDEFVRQWQEMYSQVKVFAATAFEAFSGIYTTVLDIIGEFGEIMEGMWTWQKSILAIEQAFAAIHMFVLGVKLAVQGLRLAEAHLGKMTGYADELTEKEENRLRVTKNLLQLQDEGSEEYIKSMKTINDLEAKRDGSSNKLILELEEKILKTREELGEQTYKFTEEGRKQSEERITAMSKEYGYLQAILNSEDTWDLTAAYQQAVEGSREDLEVQEKITKAYMQQLELIKVREKMKGGRVVAKSGADEEDPDGTGAAKAEKARMALEMKWDAYNAKRNQDILDYQIDLLESTENWLEGLDGIAGVVGKISSAFKDLAVTQLKGNKAQADLDGKMIKNLKVFAKDTKKVEQLKQNYIEDTDTVQRAAFTAQIDGYAAVSASMAQAFAEGSAASQAFMGIQQALSLYNAVTAVTAAWASAPFPANLPGVAATSAAVAALLAQVGQTFSGGGTSSGGTPPGYNEDTTEEYSSDSVVDILEKIYDVQYPMLELTRSMRDALVGVTNNITDLVQSFTLDGLDFNASEFTGFIKDSSSYVLDSVKLELGSGTLQQYVDGLIGGTLTTWARYSKERWYGDSTELQINRQDILSDDMMGQIGDAITGMASAAMTAGASLGLDQSTIDNALSRISLDFGTIDTQDMGEQEIIDAITGTISYAFDDIIAKSLPELNRFREAGEGYYETLVRISIETEQAGQMFDMVGKYISDWTESAEIMAASGGFDAFTANMNDFMELFTDEQQEAMRIEALTEQFAALGKTLPETNEAFIDMVNSATDPELYADLLSLSGAFGELDRAIEETVEVVEKSYDSVKAISDAWLGNLSYLDLQQRAAYASGYLNIVRQENASGLSSIDAARANAEAALKASSTREEYIPEFQKYIQELEAQAVEADLDTVVNRLDLLIEGVRDLETAQRIYA